MADSLHVDQLLCAKCQSPGSKVCTGCRLVLYCGKECQTEHWTEHKKDCKSPLGKDSWVPNFLSEQRIVVFTRGERLPARLCVRRHLWNDTPALDILGLPSNEGLDYNKDLGILFATSGDLRNVVKTIAFLAEGYAGQVSLVINDKDSAVMARNVVMLLIALNASDKESAVDCMLHMWYSAFLRPEHAELLNAKVLPHISKILENMEKTPSSAAVFVAKRKFRLGSCQIEMTEREWYELASCLQEGEDISSARTRDNRMCVTFPESKSLLKDHLDREILLQFPAYRTSMVKYCQDGILLPFGHSRHAFNVANPTLFRRGEWRVKELSNPLHGWNFKDVIATGGSLPANDLYGKLHSHIKSLLSSFYDRLSTSRCSFSLTNMDPKDLPERLAGETFARIEVSDMSEGPYMDMEKAAQCLGPLLQPRTANPNATLLMLFRRALNEVSKDDQDRDKKEFSRVREYMAKDKITIPSCALVNVMFTAKPLFGDIDKYYKTFLSKSRVRTIEKQFGLKIKDQNTIVERSPTKLKLQPHEAGATEEFKVLLASGQWGNDLYVEWQRQP